MATTELSRTPSDRPQSTVYFLNLLAPCSILPSPCLTHAPPFSVISPTSGAPYLLWPFTLRNVELRHKGSHGFNWDMLWLPVIIAPLVLLWLGWALLDSVIGLFSRDVGQDMQFFTLALMFLSAVFCSAEIIPDVAWRHIRINPVPLAIEAACNDTHLMQPLNHRNLDYLYLVGLAACYLGHLSFRRMKQAFADVLWSIAS